MIDTMAKMADEKAMRSRVLRDVPLPGSMMGYEKQL